LNHLRCTVTINEYDASATRLGSTGHDCAGIVRDTAELRFEQCYPGGDVALRVVSGL
jgi:hypothetical protein